MTRAHRPGSVQEMIGRAIDAAGPKAVEADLGVSRSLISRWSDADEENGRAMPAPKLDALCRMHPETAAPVVAQHFAQLAGGAFVGLPRCRGTIADAAAELMKETADVMGAALEALSERSPKPGDLTPAEARRIREELREAMDAQMRMLALVEAVIREDGTRAA